ncbi:5895_t:CDS:2 [Funneliformis mosseae]|uniref:5895_t:CDS:1 n=1 Tax=Funneliformis mosseae TaxID=27381 RepID=A0A9N9BBP0_FUNMO|nr:5895_t:CDS:2 [Funneliformis mosseae]
MNNDIQQSTLTPGELQNTLQSAIDACRSNLGGINNQAMVQIVKENQPSYCDIIPGHLLYYVGTSQEVKIYVPINAVTSTNLFQTHSAQLNRFLNVLKRLAEVFQLASEVIHIFYDTNSSSVAFNSKGALFFNLKFFLKSHDDECEIGNTGNAMTYWFLTFCHELAHNIIFVHNSKHEVSIF